MKQKQKVGTFDEKSRIFFCELFQVNPGSKAEEAGLREGDVIDEINGIPPVTLEEAKQLQKISESGLCLKFSRKSAAKLRSGRSFSSDESEGRKTQFF